MASLCISSLQAMHRHRLTGTLIQLIGFMEVAQWLSCCATNRKVAGSIPYGVIGIFH